MLVLVLVLDRFIGCVNAVQMQELSNPLLSHVAQGAAG